MICLLAVFLSLCAPQWENFVDVFLCIINNLFGKKAENGKNEKFDCARIYNKFSFLSLRSLSHKHQRKRSGVNTQNQQKINF